MPVKITKTNNSKTNSYTNDDVKSALRRIHEGESYGKISQVYGIPKSTLYAKFNGIHPIEYKKGPDPVLKDEEIRIKNWILNKARLGFPMHADDVKDAVKKVLDATGQKNLFTDNRPGEKWFKLFLNRHPEISKRNTEVLSKSRAAVTEEKIKDWFDEVREYLVQNDKESVLERPDSIFNGDETGLELCPKSGKLLGPRNEKDFYEIPVGGEKENITVLCTFSASGKAVPPMLLFPYSRIPGAIARSIPDGWSVGRSKKGWMESSTFFEYVANVFFPWCIKNNVQLPVIFFVDGHKSHLSYELSDYCVQHEIILVALFPNSTHIIQPCDVGIFRPVKIKWRIKLRAKRNESQKKLSREEVGPLFKECFDELNPEVIQNSFRKCGLFPYNKDAVDYNKCISTRRSKIFSSSSSHKYNELSYDDLVSTKKFLYLNIPQDKLIEFEDIRSRDEKSTELSYLLWEKCLNELEELSISSEDSSLVSLEQTTRDDFLDTSEHNASVVFNGSMVSQNQVVNGNFANESCAVISTFEEQSMSSLSPEILSVEDLLLTAPVIYSSEFDATASSTITLSETSPIKINSYNTNNVYNEYSPAIENDAIHNVSNINLIDKHAEGAKQSACKEYRENLSVPVPIDNDLNRNIQENNCNSRKDVAQSSDDEQMTLSFDPNFLNSDEFPMDVPIIDISRVNSSFSSIINSSDESITNGITDREMHNCDNKKSDINLTKINEKIDINGNDTSLDLFSTCSIDKNLEVRQQINYKESQERLNINDHTIANKDKSLVATKDINLILKSTLETETDAIWDKHLFWPSAGIPQKPKKKPDEKNPTVITSEEYRDAQLRIKTAKEKEQSEKEERAIKRKIKSEEKEIETKKKKEDRAKKLKEINDKKIQIAKDKEQKAVLKAKERDEKAVLMAKEKEEKAVLKAKEKEEKASLKAKEKEEKAVLKAKEKENKAVLKVKESKEKILQKQKMKKEKFIEGEEKVSTSKTIPLQTVDKMERIPLLDKDINTEFDKFHNNESPVDLTNYKK